MRGGRREIAKPLFEDVESKRERKREVGVRWKKGRSEGVIKEQITNLHRPIESTPLTPSLFVWLNIFFLLYIVYLVSCNKWFAYMTLKFIYFSLVLFLVLNFVLPSEYVVNLALICVLICLFNSRPTFS